MGQTVSQSTVQFPADGEAFIPGLGTDSNDLRPTSKRKFKHPMAALFHVMFKILALLVYLFGGVFGQDFTSTFVAVILLVSMDFWVVKNVTGRLLAGLRWSNYIDDEGNSHWIFENKNANKNSNSSVNLSDIRDELYVKDGAADSAIFWLGLTIAPALWSLLTFISIFRLNLQWFMLVILALVLSLSNLFGYIRCRVGTSDIKSSVTQFVAKQVFYNFITGGGSSSNKPTA